MKIEEEIIENSNGEIFGKKGKPITPKMGLDSIANNSKYAGVGAILGVAAIEGSNNFMTYLLFPFLTLELTKRYFESKDISKQLKSY